MTDSEEPLMGVRFIFRGFNETGNDFSLNSILKFHANSTALYCISRGLTLDSKSQITQELEASPQDYIA